MPGMCIQVPGLLTGTQRLKVREYIGGKEHEEASWCSHWTSRFIWHSATCAEESASLQIWLLSRWTLSGWLLAGRSRTGHSSAKAGRFKVWDENTATQANDAIKTLFRKKKSSHCGIARADDHFLSMYFYHLGVKCQAMMAHESVDSSEQFFFCFTHEKFFSHHNQWENRKPSTFVTKWFFFIILLQEILDWWSKLLQS